MIISQATVNKPFVKVLFFLGLIILGFWVASLFPDLVLTLIISILTAFVLKPLVYFFEYRFNLRRGLAIGIVFLLVGGITVFALI